MGEIIRRPGQVAKPRPKPQPKGERSDPTEWRPRDNSDWEQTDSNVRAETFRSEPLYYESLADKSPFDIAGIEATTKADLLRRMDQLGLYPDERGVRTHWALVVQGHGFRMPEGFIHPEAPDDVKEEGREAWRRVVQIASDSLDKFLFVKVWRRKVTRLPHAPAPKVIEERTPEAGEFEY